MFTSAISQNNFSRFTPINIQNTSIPIEDTEKTSTIFKNHFSSDQNNANRMSFFLRRFRSIDIVLTKKLTFNLEEFILDPAIRKKAIAYVQRRLRRKIKKTWASFLKETEPIRDNLISKPIPKHFKAVNNVLKCTHEIGKIVQSFFEIINVFTIIHHVENLLSLGLHVTNLCGRLKKEKIDFTFNEFECFNSILEGFYDVGAIGSSFIEALDNNIFFKMAYEAIGLGEDFTPFTSGLLEACVVLDTCLTVFRLYFKSKKMCEAIYKWSKCNDETPPNELSKIRLEVFKSAIALAKDVVKITLKILVFLGVLPQIPVFVTVILAGVGVVLISIKIYSYFALSESKEDLKNDNYNEIDEEDSELISSEIFDDEMFLLQLG